MKLHSTMALILPVSLAVAGCSEKPSDGGSAGNGPQNDRASSSDTPDIAPSTAPGVAFNYGYRFALGADKIATVQERHAAACEALGLDKCRITGMTFSRPGRDQVSATLDLALAPDIARKFGKDAISAAEAAKGHLVSVDIEGIDRNADVRATERDSDAAKTEALRLEAQLAESKAGSAERRMLLQRIAEQKAAARDAQSRAEDVRASLANTPMHINYSTDGFLPGISLDRTAWSALGVAAMMLNALFALLVVAVTLAIPVGLLILVFAHGRKVVGKIWQRLSPTPED